MNRPFSIQEVKPGIFLLEFKHHYDMCMHFLRYQEFYESSSAQFRNKSFLILDFMRWYTLKYGKGSFTYPNDWNGFNIPGDTIKKVHDLGILDRNIYDYEMLMAWKECANKAQGNKFYIIGVVKGNKALNHEIAHGLFYLNSEYKKEMTALVKALDPNLRKKINDVLKKLGYTPKVYIDETQAYMSTGIVEAFGPVSNWYKLQKPFIELYKKFTRKTNEQR